MVYKCPDTRDDPTLWRGNLLAMKAYLMTQRLQHTRLIVWVKG